MVNTNIMNQNDDMHAHFRSEEKHVGRFIDKLYNILWNFYRQMLN